MVFQQRQQQPGLLPVTECSPQARCSAQHATSTLSLPFRESHRTQTWTALCIWWQTRSNRELAQWRPYWAFSPAGGGDDISAVPRALYIVSVCLPGWGAALFEDCSWAMGALLLAWSETCLHLPWVQDSECSAPLLRVGTTLRRKLPSRAPTAGLGWSPPHRMCPEVTSLRGLLPFPVLLPSCLYWCALGKLPS